MILIMARKWRNGAHQENSVVLAFAQLAGRPLKGDKVFVVSDDVRWCGQLQWNSDGYSGETWRKRRIWICL